MYPPDARWAEPDLDHAAELMREVRAGGDAVRAAGRARAPRRRGGVLARGDRRGDARAARAARSPPRRWTGPGPAVRSQALQDLRDKHAYDRGEGSPGVAADHRRQGAARGPPVHVPPARSQRARAEGARGAGAAHRRARGAAAARAARDRRRAAQGHRRRREASPSSSAGWARTTDVTRGEAVVCIPVFGARDLFEQCLRSVVEHTPPGTHVLVADDASPDPEIEAFTRRVAEEVAERLPVEYVRRAREPRLRRQHERGLPRHGAGRRRDRQLRHRRARRAGSSACAPPPTPTGSWRPPARSPTTARSSPSPTATRPVADAAAGALDHRGRRAHRPRLAAAAPAHPDRHRALPLHPPLGARARRRLRRGVLARLRRGGRLLASAARRAGCGTSSPTTSTSSTAARARSAAHAERAPARQRGRAQPPLPLLRRGRARGRDVGVDPARALAGGGAAGDRRAVGDDRRLLPRPDADRHAGARARAGRARSRGARRRAPARHGPALDRRRARARCSTRSGSSGCGTTRSTTTPSRPTSSTGPTRSRTPRDLLLLGRLGRRVVLTQQDSIAYHNPAYFADYAELRGYRELTRLGLAFADRVVFSLAARAARRALRGPRRRRARAARAARGRPPRRRRPTREPVAPAGVEGRPFLLCLGTDFLHKNRLFALRLFARAARAPRLRRPARVRRPARRARHLGRRGGGVAARRTRGSRTTSSSSASAPRPRRRGCTANTALVLYPTVFEGFGFVPFEAAEAGVPVLWAAQSSMADLLPVRAARASCRGTSTRRAVQRRRG